MIDAAITQGWSGLALGYAAVQVPMLAALVRGRAKFQQIVLSPVFAVPLTVVAGIGIALSSSVLSRWGIAGDSVAQLAYGVGCCAA